MTEDTFICQIIQDESGELVIVFPDDLLQRLGWQEGDTIDWDTDANNRITARRAKIGGPVGP